MKLEQIIEQCKPNKLKMYKDAIEALNPDYREKLKMIYDGICKAEPNEKDAFFEPFLKVMEDMEKDIKYKKHISAYKEIYISMTSTN
jgi:hypothetical protein